ncbi:hypothetical protein QTP88_025948 [Uroleucon formosanum]
MTSRSQPSPALTTALFLLLLDTVSATVSITRHHRGDVFDVSDVKCSMETCVEVSSGTASLVDGIVVAERDYPSSVGSRGYRQSTGTSVEPLHNGNCRCQCIQHVPIFRDDLRICVDDLQECSLASFVSGTTVQKIPYVFLPLQGQIVYPSAEIKIAGMQYPICAISKAKYLTRGGWVNFKNQSDFEIPFQIHRENGHIMLLWLGDLQSRTNIEGRLVLIEMICKETLSQDYDSSFHQAITPCLSFRIAGTPSVKEVLFSTDIRSSDNASSSGLTISELIAVAICSILLGLMYVASILLYLHVRKGRPKGQNGDIEAFKNPLMSNGINEEGIVKNNPLLQHSYNDNEAFESDEDRNYSISTQGEPSMDMMENNNINRNLTTAIVHPIQSFNSCVGQSMYYSDSNSIEKHPEEDISIVETLDNKEDRPDNIRSIVYANPRKKLYFNPDYFELELLMAPPPAALEFLEKIREVIHEAKRKITMKKFTPNLIVILEDPNEDTNEPLSSCNKCKTQFKIKSATIQKWLMNVPTEVTKLKKNQAPCVPVELKGKDNVNYEIDLQLKENELKSQTDKEEVEDKGEEEEEEKVIEEEDDDDEEEQGTNIECDSLERSMNYRQKCGYHTPSDYGFVRPDLSPVLSNSALPMDEELTIKTTYTYDTITKRESYYEHISGPDCIREKPKKEILPDILNRSSERYSLVSEVYVNDNFNTSMSPNNSLDKKIKKKSPGQITIEVEDCPDNHPAEDSDSFEPDTLDRNCTKIKPNLKAVYSTDSLEQFNSPKSMNNNGYGSLLEIYEAKNVMADVQKKRNMSQLEAKYLKPDPKHCRRQRCPSPLSVQKPPKNACVRSTSKPGVMQSDCVSSQFNQRTHNIIAGASDKQAVKSSPIDNNRYEDSGYLSTESNESLNKVVATSLDTDESGAESIDTDFKFYKSRTDRNYCDW